MTVGPKRQNATDPPYLIFTQMRNSQIDPQSQHTSHIRYPHMVPFNDFPLNWVLHYDHTHTTSANLEQKRAKTGPVLQGLPVTGDQTLTVELSAQTEDGARAPETGDRWQAAASWYNGSVKCCLLLAQNLCRCRDIFGIPTDFARHTSLWELCPACFPFRCRRNSTPSICTPGLWASLLALHQLLICQRGGALGVGLCCGVRVWVMLRLRATPSLGTGGTCIENTFTAPQVM